MLFYKKSRNVKTSIVIVPFIKPTPSFKRIIDQKNTTNWVSLNPVIHININLAKEHRSEPPQTNKPQGKYRQLDKPTWLTNERMRMRTAHTKLTETLDTQLLNGPTESWLGFWGSRGPVTSEARLPMECWEIYWFPTKMAEVSKHME